MQVEIWSDVVCPWCYVGKRRFERALAAFPHADDVTVVYRSFELDPSAPGERAGSHAEHLSQKYGMTVQRAHELNEQMTQTAAADGLEFRLADMRGGNTFDAHRLLHLAHKRGRQDELKERLLRATFSEGQPISDRDTLVALGAAAGLDSDDVRAVLTSDAYAADVRADEQQAAAFGITGVPFFVVDRRYGVSGAQPTDVLLELLQTAYDEARPTISTGGARSGATCGDDACAV